MAWTTLTLAERLRELQWRLRGLQALVQQKRDRSAAGTSTDLDWQELLDTLRGARAVMAGIPRTQRVTDFAINLWNYTGDLGADIAAIEAAGNTLGDGIASALTGRTLSYNTATWERVLSAYTAGQTGAHRANCDTLLAALNTFQVNISDPA